ncbi:transglycosylase family protein [Streptomyces sp. NPDC126499]|uniref:transglycosylase family protein n=1 Tax=Streptomyces sp. NPDC126499 TaxID=3155314 RepID=UPI00332FCF74
MAVRGTRGKHRRYQPSRINRASLTVTAGGAGMALPLIGAGTAQAASLDVWEKLASCESSSNWQINTGNGYFGGLQFSQATWERYGGTHFAPRADLASKDQQIAVAERVLKGQGPGAWPACAPGAGLDRAGLDRGDEAPGAAPQTAGVRPLTQVALPAQRTGPAGGGAPASPTTVPTVREMYTVTPGDSLSKIARDQHVRGGWPRLYEANRTVVGDDPDLIHPGQRLTLRIAVPAAPPSARPDTRPQQKPSPRPSTQPPAPPKQLPKPTPEPKTTAKPPTAPPARPSTAPTAKPAPSAPAARPTPTRPAAQPVHRPAPKPVTKPAARPPAKPSAKPPARPAVRPAPKPPVRPAPKPPAAGFTSPVADSDVGTRYRKQGSSWSSGYHTGVDFPVPTGTSVRAVATGRVVSAGWGGAYGYEVVIRHQDGRYSQYAHLSALTVREGQRVNTGQRIGRSGSTGNSSGPHLHFEVRTGPGYGSDIDPLAYLRARGVSI